MMRLTDRRGWIMPMSILLGVLVGVPIITLAYYARKTNQSFPSFVAALVQGANPTRGLSQALRTTSRFASQPIGAPPAADGGGDHPLITHVAAADLDQDGLLDALVCDARQNAVTWIRQAPAGQFTEQVIGGGAAGGIVAPARTEACDIDRDGDLDVLVAVLGMLFPNNERIGSVVVLENDGGLSFTPRVIADKIARVADVRGADFDGDGDIDLAVAQFGANDGETSWLENTGPWRFTNHTLQSLNGTINCEVIDMDGDADLDIVTVVSQEWEELYIHVNDGKGHFEPRLIYGADNDDYGSSGIDVADLDGDGDLDVAYTNGDAFDYTPPRPRPWHGVQWLENRGGHKFLFHRLADFPGAYSPRAVDIDADGDLDIIAVSGFNKWEQPTASSMVWLENVGQGAGDAAQFIAHDAATAPTHLIAVDAGDFNRDGLLDLVSGGVHFYPPYDRIGRVTLWINRGR